MVYTTFLQVQKIIRFKPDVNRGPEPYPDEAGRTYRPEGQWTWQWYGNNAQTDCGLKIAKTVRYDNGEWQFTFANAEGGFFLYVRGMNDARRTAQLCKVVDGM